ncbi:MAG: DUF4062 domain-containing protein [Acidimicrobiales bacterium]
MISRGGQPAEQLLVDLAPAPPVAETEVQAWAADQHVFVSSVMAGMTAEREAAVGVIASVGAHPVWFEAFGGMDDDPEDAYTAQVASSDIYLGILGGRYGKPLKTGYSATHAEYNEATNRGLRISVWTTSAEQDGRQRDFLDEVRVFHTTGTYSSPDDLAGRVERRLRAIAADALAPWVKVGPAVFRASSIHDDGKTLTVVARVRDHTVTASLLSRRPDASFGRNSDTRITWAGGTSPARVKTVVSETTSSRSTKVTVTAERTAENRSNLIDMGMNGKSPEDLTELAARIVLFGEPNPLDLMSFMVDGTNPLEALATVSLPEDSVESVARLLVTEFLVGERGADHITSFQLGPQRAGRRRLRLAWEPRRRYTNVKPVERSIDGEIARSTP